MANVMWGSAEWAMAYAGLLVDYIGVPCPPRKRKGNQTGKLKRPSKKGKRR